MLELLREKTGLNFEEAKDMDGNPVYWTGRLIIFQGLYDLTISYNNITEVVADPKASDGVKAELRWKAVNDAIKSLVPSHKLGGK